MISIITKNHTAFIGGDTNNIMKNDGTAPIKGPKNGIMLVIPITKDINVT